MFIAANIVCCRLRHQDARCTPPLVQQTRCCHNIAKLSIFCKFLCTGGRQLFALPRLSHGQRPALGMDISSMLPQRTVLRSFVGSTFTASLFGIALFAFILVRICCTLWNAKRRANDLFLTLATCSQRVLLTVIRNWIRRTIQPYLRALACKDARTNIRARKHAHTFRVVQ
jgi:hypothetical protein